MTRLTALRALLEQPDPEDLRTAEGVTRGHRKIYETADPWTVSISFVFRMLRTIRKELVA